MLIFIIPLNILLQNVFNGGYQYQYHFTKAEQTKFKLLIRVPAVFRRWQSEKTGGGEKKKGEMQKVTSQVRISRQRSANIEPRIVRKK